MLTFPHRYGGMRLLVAQEGTFLHAAPLLSHLERRFNQWREANQAAAQGTHLYGVLKLHQSLNELGKKEYLPGLSLRVGDGDWQERFKKLWGREVRSSQGAPTMTIVR